MTGQNTKGTVSEMNVVDSMKWTGQIHKGYVKHFDIYYKGDCKPSIGILILFYFDFDWGTT